MNKATTFNLVVIDVPSGAEAFVTRLYQEVLGRSPDPDLQLWVNEIQRFGSVVTVVVAFFDSTEFLNRHLSNQEFVRVLYRTFLDREPDPGGLSAFLSELQGGCRTRDNLIDIFIRSPEFANLASFLPPLDAVTAFVTNAYVGILGRGPDLAGLTFWVNQLNQTRSVLALVNAFLGSSEFLALNTTNAQFVTVLYGALLGRVPDCPGLASWVAALNAGTLTRSQLVAQFAASPEFALIQMKLFPPDA